jgi:hypothetical protein
MSGEIDIAGFEIGAIGGCRGYAVAWGINSFFFGLGMLTRPRHLFRAFTRARGARNAYSLESAEGDLLGRRLADVRMELRIPDHPPTPTFGDRLAFALWGLLGVTLVLAAPAILVWTLAR